MTRAARFTTRPIDVVARHQHHAAVDAGPQWQRRRLAQLEAGEHGRLRLREGEHEAVAEPLEHASPRLRTIGPDSRWWPISSRLAASSPSASV